jgi:hypothetical protein
MTMLRMITVCCASAETLLCMFPDGAAQVTHVAAQVHRLFSAGASKMHLMGNAAVLLVT